MMSMDLGSLLFIAGGSAIGFYILMMTAPWRKQILWFSWFIDVGITALLIMIFGHSTSGMAIAMLGGLIFSVLRNITVKLMKPEPPFYKQYTQVTKLFRRKS